VRLVGITIEIYYNAWSYKYQVFRIYTGDGLCEMQALVEEKIEY
jgi:hypothetical protein